ncbi:hypothetical protein HPB50_015599 [Hyalomma asiaticum]|uniref:Uncharacterized protein n=1 Tax=Hyalomma asiaticum TaxID=266040 RepID=A0ACB7SYF3_HYAAI|nr:hypothetical protein HPB50_015599 [Hyalomma asiaticum]
MSYSVSPETLAVLQNFHERVKNRLQRLREQEEWRSYCARHNIVEKPQRNNNAAGPTGAPRRAAAHTTPRRITIRKVSASSPAYCLRSLSDQLAVYYRELERLQSDSYGTVARLKSPETQTSCADRVLTVCAQTQTVSAVAAPECISGGHDLSTNSARERFRVRLNPDPNERFSVVRKERVFRPLDGIRRRVTWAGPVVESKKENRQDRRASCDAHGSRHTAKNLSYTKNSFEGNATWKSLLEHDATRDPWAVIDSITDDILGDVLSTVLEEVERVFSGIIDELLHQEFAERVNE